MPVPKGFPYGKIYGHMINSGKSKEEAKAITERAMKHWKKKKGAK